MMAVKAEEEMTSGEAEAPRAAPSILDGVDLSVPPPLAHERNYVQYFAVGVGGIPGNDHYIYRHANGLCVVGLAPSHAGLRLPGPELPQVDFDMGRSKQHAEVTGKHKKNARMLDADSVLCKVTFAGGEVYPIRSCVKGALLELNWRVFSHPSLLRERASSDGYIAIVMPRPTDWTKYQGQLLSKEQYMMHHS